MKIPHVLIFACVILTVRASLCLAQSNYTESLTITTYYPSPYGVYRNLKLNPTDTVPSGPALSAGVMYYNKTENVLKYYNDSTWVNITGGGGGGGYWTESGDDIYNTNMGNVGIGIPNPVQRLSVAGDISASGVLIAGTGLTPTPGAIRFNGTGFEGYYNEAWNPLGGGTTTPASGTWAGGITIHVFSNQAGSQWYESCAQVTTPGLCSCVSAAPNRNVCTASCDAGWTWIQLSDSWHMIPSSGGLGEGDRISSCLKP